MLLTPILFAASITLGEMLVAERRFVFYALAPILYNVGIVGGTVLLHDAIGITAAAVGAVIGASLHLGIRVVGMRRLDGAHPASAGVRHARAPRVRAADAAQDARPADRADHVPVLHQRGLDARRRVVIVGQLRAQLPERAGGDDRRRDLARGVPGPVGVPGRPATGRVRAARPDATW